MAAEVVMIEGRPFAVGDLVLVDWYTGEWFAGVVEEIRPYHAYPIIVKPSPGDPLRCVHFCTPSEVHTHRENFA